MLILVLLACWGAWLVHGNVSVYSVSTAARLEAARAAHPIQSLHTGRIAANRIVLGSEVQQGDVLVELNTNVQRLQLIEEQMQGESIQTEIATLRNEITAEQGAMKEEKAAAAIGVDEARARLREAETAAEFAAAEAERYTKLEAAGLASQAEFARASAEAQKQRAATEGVALGIRRQQKEQSVRSSERRSRIAALGRQMNQLAGLQAKLGAVVDRMESEMDLLRIVAPVSGTIGEVANLKIGAVVSAGERLGAIVPGGSLKVVAQFNPADAIGRIRAGQRARVRLAGFPWTQFGTLSATVTSVANEVRDGLVRVELQPKPGSRLALRHGLPGATEVEVEQVSPGALVLRIAGQMLTQKRPVGQTNAATVPQFEEGAR